MDYKCDMSPLSNLYHNFPDHVKLSYVLVKHSCRTNISNLAELGTVCLQSIKIYSISKILWTRCSSSRRRMTKALDWSLMTGVCSSPRNTGSRWVARGKPFNKEEMTKNAGTQTPLWPNNETARALRYRAQSRSRRPRPYYRDKVHNTNNIRGGFRIRRGRAPGPSRVETRAKASGVATNLLFTTVGSVSTGELLL